MVDHVEFSSADIVDRFISYWRGTGEQRFGFLYGRYEPYLEVPLGTKAVVEAVYEPPQRTKIDGVTVERLEEEALDQLAHHCGLVKVGMIFTDLTDDGSGQGTTLPKRHANSFFLSSLECYLAAHLQATHPNRCRWSATGTFGSRFVTCVVSGNTEGQVDISAFQVSNTAVSMVGADLIRPSVEPSLMLVKPSTASRYVPEVFYQYRNEYGASVKKAAQPTFPVDYLLTTMTHGFPSLPNAAFKSPLAFPIENRGHGFAAADPSALRRRLLDVSPLQLADFHLLCYIQGLSILSEEEMQLLARVAVHQDAAALASLQDTAGWKTLLSAVQDSGHASMQMDDDIPETVIRESRAMAREGRHSSGHWSCTYCTFSNPPSREECAMCGLPRHAAE